MGGGKNAWFQPFAHARNFPINLRNLVILVFFRVWIMHNHIILVFFLVMATCSYSDDEFSSALVLRIIYTSEGYSDGKPWRNDHVVIVLLFVYHFYLYHVVLCDDVLIENNNSGCVIMQNNEAMKIVNFTHAQTAETRRSFFFLPVNAEYEARQHQAVTKECNRKL